MKKFIVVLLTLALMLSALCVFVACNDNNQSGGNQGGGNDQTHTHTYSAEWTCDDTYHWHAATCEHTDEVSGKAAHTFESSVCTECGYVLHTGEGLAFTLSDDGTYYILTGIGTCTDLNVIVPFEHEGLPVKEIGSSAFKNCSGLTSIEIPDGVTNISYGAFFGCTSLRYNVYDNAKYLGNSDNPYVAMIGVTDTSITSCNIHENTKVICDGAFYGCIHLTDIDMPDSVTNIGKDAFYGCSGLTSVTIPDSVTSIGGAEFYKCIRLTSVIIGDGVTSIGSQAFSGCSELTSVTIGDSVTSIGYKAFDGCTSLQYNVYGNAKYLGNSGNPYVALIEPRSMYISSCNIHENTKVISDYAFYSIELTSVTIGDSVTNIGSSAFYGCSELTSITIPNSVTSIGNSAFSRCSGLTSITVSAGNSVYHSAENCLIETATKTLILGCKNSVIPTDGSVTSIGDEAFYECTGLTSIEIPDSVTSIGWAAFNGCSRLTSVTLPDGVTSIGDAAFSGCSGLTSVTIPDSVTSIGNSAFNGCSRLTSIVFNGTKAQWRAIEKGGSWNSNTGYYTIHCTDGDI